MLRKMYLVTPEHFRGTEIKKQLAQPPTAPVKKKNEVSHKLASHHKQKKKRHVRENLHPYDKWVMMRESLEEKDLKREALIKEIAKFLGKVLPKNVPLQTFPTKNEHLETSVRAPEIPVLPSTSASSSPSTSDVIFETPKKKPVVEIRDDDDDEQAKLYSRQHYGEIASPFLSPYVKDSRLLDTQYGIRRVGDNFKIGNAMVTIDNMSNITVKGKQFKGTQDLWNLLTRKNVNYDAIDKDELKKYKSILELTNAHLEGYRSGANIQTSRGTKFKNVIAKLFPEAKAAIQQKWTTY